ncbi:MAG: ParB/RepB/Spo0J family partition protein [Gammaproteobacteria bacterium]
MVEQFKQVPIDLIHPGRYQPRTVFPEASLSELAQTVREQGIVEPVVLRPHPEIDRHFELIAGERRWRAAQRAGLSKVPAMIRDLDDEAAAAQALVENLQREDLNPVDKAAAMARMCEQFQWTHAEVGQAMGVGRVSVTRQLRILQLPESVLDHVRCGALTEGHARVLTTLPDDFALSLARQAVRTSLSVRALERRVKQSLNQTNDRARSEAQVGDPDIRNYATELGERIGFPVTVEKHKDDYRLTVRNDGWTVRIEASGLEALEDAVERFLSPPR